MNTKKTLRYTAIGIGPLGRGLLRNLPLGKLPGEGRFLSIAPDSADLAFEKYTAPRLSGNPIEYLSSCEAESLHPFVDTADVVVILGALRHGPEFTDIARISKNSGAEFVLSMPTRPFTASNAAQKDDLLEEHEIFNCSHGVYVTCLNSDFITEPDENGTTYLSNAHTAVGFDVVYNLRRFLEMRNLDGELDTPSFGDSADWFLGGKSSSKDISH